MHSTLAMAAATLGLAAAAVDLSGHISAPDLAERIMRGDSTLRVFDLRSRAEYDQLHIPTARHAALEGLAREPLPRDASSVLYSESGAPAALAWAILHARGYRHVFFLRGGIDAWIRRVLDPRLAGGADAKHFAGRTAHRRHGKLRGLK
jgi:rhodanese-related sulfurtransferase